LFLKLARSAFELGELSLEAGAFGFGTWLGHGRFPKRERCREDDQARDQPAALQRSRHACSIARADLTGSRAASK
jgi:hypothetical protein